jgi:type IV pilus assembly protein PilC
LQTFDIVGRGHDNPAVGKLLLDIKADVETGSSLSQAFRKYPLHFDALYCNLVAAGEQAGILETLLDRLATYKEKMIAIKSKIKAALFYPVAIIVVAFVITAVIMIFVIPAFKEVFKSFGADLPTPTLIVIAMSDFFIEYWWLHFRRHRRLDLRLLLHLEALGEDADRLRPPVPALAGFGDIIRKVGDRPLDTHAGHHVRGRRAAGRIARIRRWSGRQLRIQGRHPADPERGQHRHQPHVGDAERPTALPEHGQSDGGHRRGVRRQLDSMLGKVADFFEAEVDDAVEALSSLMEPMIMVVLGVLIGGMVIAMYLPIFKLGAVVG